MGMNHRAIGPVLKNIKVTALIRGDAKKIKQQHQRSASNIKDQSSTSTIEDQYKRFTPKINIKDQQQGSISNLNHQLCGLVSSHNKGSGFHPLVGRPTYHTGRSLGDHGRNRCQSGRYRDTCHHIPDTVLRPGTAGWYCTESGWLLPNKINVNLLNLYYINILITAISYYNHIIKQYVI